MAFQDKLGDGRDRVNHEDRRAGRLKLGRVIRESCTWAEGRVVDGSTVTVDLLQ